MTTATVHPWLASLLAGHASVPARPHGWVNQLRSDALERAHALTLPTIRQEDWRFTDLSPLYQLAFRAAAPAAAPAGLGLEPVIAPEAGARLVFVDGQFVPALSILASDGVVATTLGAAFDAHADLVRSRLAQLAPFADDAFRAINTAHLADGALVFVARDAVARSPVQLIFATTQADVATHPRCLVVAGQGSEVTVVEDYVGLQHGASCVNAVTEIAVGQNAHVRHVRRQRESSASFHIATCAVRLERDASYRSVAVAVGARISRYNLNVLQAGEGTSCQLDGLALIRDRQLADTHSFIDHAHPHGTSRQLHKCVVGGHAHAVFNGRIMVRPGAQRTDSSQASRNLLLSRRAHVDTKPQLEIFADDVKCAHGATVGQLEAEELFYLQSRGLSEPVARGLLTYGFAAEIVDRIPVPSIVESLRRTVLHETQGGALT
ncbi:MAG: Fe-S cluster assembly protein SufD [Burkholderiales bacterium]